MTGFGSKGETAMFTVRERFRLAESFLDQYKGRQPDWGPLGYITLDRKSTRLNSSH